MRALWRRIAFLWRARKTWERGEVVPQCASCGALMGHCLTTGEDYGATIPRSRRDVCLWCYSQWTVQQREAFKWRGEIPCPPTPTEDPTDE